MRLSLTLLSPLTVRAYAPDALDHAPRQARDMAMGTEQQPEQGPVPGRRERSAAGTTPGQDSVQSHRILTLRQHSSLWGA